MERVNRHAFAEKIDCGTDNPNPISFFLQILHRLFLSAIKFGQSPDIICCYSVLQYGKKITVFGTHVRRGLAKKCGKVKPGIVQSRQKFAYIDGAVIDNLWSISRALLKHFKRIKYVIM
jgi:hypothetical protein